MFAQQKSSTCTCIYCHKAYFSFYVTVLFLITDNGKFCNRLCHHMLVRQCSRIFHHIMQVNIEIGCKVSFINQFFPTSLGELDVSEDRLQIKYQGKILKKFHSLGYLGVCRETILKAEVTLF